MNAGGCVDLEAEEIRRHLLGLGTVVESLLITSDPLRRIYEQLRLVVYLKVPGCWLAASHGRGKTIAIEYCAKRLKVEIPGLPVFIVNEQVLPGNELKSFFIRALSESGYDKPFSTSPAVLRQRLAMYWAELSKASPLHCVVLFLDEGQSMRELDESLLKDLSNQIVRMGGSLLTITFGESPAFEALISKRKDPLKFNGAADRIFGGRELVLSDYVEKSDWESLFTEMDTTPFEKLGGQTITQAYFSHMNIRDFKLKDEVPRFRKALKLVYGARAIKDVNLRRVFVAIRHTLLMTGLAAIDQRLSTLASISDENWLEGLRFSYHA